jgi:hypothetical protein
MKGLLSGQLFLTGREENVIKAKNQNEKHSAWYRLKFSDGARDFACTCGSSWKVEVEPGKVVEFNVNQLHLFSKYNITVDVDMSSGYAKLKLRTFKPVSDK